jgi:hypothetical protein
MWQVKKFKFESQTIGQSCRNVRLWHKRAANFQNVCTRFTKFGRKSTETFQVAWGCEILGGVVLIRIDENSATLTPFGSLIRITPAKSRSATSWIAKLGKIFARLFR